MEKQSVNPVFQLLGFLSIAGAILIACALTNDYLNFQRGSQVEKLQIIWKKDLQKLQFSKSLPKGWLEISEVKYFGGTDKAKKWIPSLKSPIKINETGKYSLEVLILDWEENGTIGAVFQYSLTNKESGNLEWELGRTYILSK